MKREKPPDWVAFCLSRGYEKDIFLRFKLRFRTTTEHEINEKVESILIDKLEFVCYFISMLNMIGDAL